VLRCQLLYDIESIEDSPYPLLGLVGGTLGRIYWLSAGSTGGTGQKEGAKYIERIGYGSRKGTFRWGEGDGRGCKSGDVLEIDDCWFIR
jgi:hypothetical protein